MTSMVFLIESVAACAIFTLFVFLMSRDPVKTIFNYPPAIIERCRQLHHLLERSAHRLCTVVRGELV